MHPDKPRLDEGQGPQRPADAPQLAPEDVAGLYSWANLEGAKYRDFSADRDQARSVRQRKTPAAAVPAPTAAPGPRRLLTAVKKSTPSAPHTAPKRWSALRSIFDPSVAEDETLTHPDIVLSTPSLAFVSPAGGVGKTVLAASVARSLAAQGHRLLLVDTQPCGMMPLLFGTPDLKPGAVANVACGPRGAALSVLTRNNAPDDAEPATHATLLQQIALHEQPVDRILIDAASGSLTQLGEILGFATNIVVVLTPDMASVTGLQPLRALVEAASDAETAPQVHYLLNQFNPASRLHVAIREALAAQLDGQLLPFVLPCSGALHEALADGTPLDLYAPDDPLLPELQRLTRWAAELHEDAAAQTPVQRWRAL